MDTPVLFQDMTQVPLPVLAGAVANLTLGLRNVDRAELADFYLGGEFDYDKAYEAIMASAQASDELYLMVVGGVPAALYGILNSGLGSRRDVWLMGTPAIYDARMGFLRESKVMVAKWAAQSELPMGADVDARHTETIAWLEWLGFEQGARIEHLFNPELYQVEMTYVPTSSGGPGRSSGGDVSRISRRANPRRERN